jgi:hypothetical protein
VWAENWCVHCLEATKQIFVNCVIKTFFRLAAGNIAIKIFFSAVNNIFVRGTNFLLA